MQKSAIHLNEENFQVIISKFKHSVAIWLNNNRHKGSITYLNGSQHFKSLLGQLPRKNHHPSRQLDQGGAAQAKKKGIPLLRLITIVTSALRFLLPSYGL